MAWTIISGETYNIVDVDAETCGDNCSIDINDMISTPISGITSLKEFKDIMTSELIDVKSRKTQASYPTLKLVYDRYMNSTDYCDTQSAQFGYCDMIQFSELVGTYWVDLIEQVVPSTTIWGSTYVYGNTFWDQQKFQYKGYSLFTCNLPYFGGDVLSPTTAFTTDVQVEYETLPNDEYYDEVSGSTIGETFSDIKYQRIINGIKNEASKSIDCIGVGIVQINCGSEFIGKIVDYNNPPPPSTGGTVTPPNDDVVITECSIAVQLTDYFVSEGNNQMIANIGGDVTGPITYLWSDGQTTQTAINLVAGQTYSVVATDNGVGGCYATSNEITIPEVGLAIGDCAHGGFVFYLDGNGGGLVAAIDDIPAVSGCDKFKYRGDWNVSVPPTSPNIGDGQQNTLDLVALFPVVLQPYAAGVANDYVNSGGSCGGVFTDWFLPSRDELEAIRVNLSSVGDLVDDFNFISEVDAFSCDGPNYWSSTIGGDNANTMIPFGGPFLLNQNKNSGYVRAIRKF